MDAIIVYLFLSGTIHQMPDLDVCAHMALHTKGECIVIEHNYSSSEQAKNAYKERRKMQCEQDLINCGNEHMSRKLSADETTRLLNSWASGNASTQ